MVYPSDLVCRVTVPQTPRNPYAIRICEHRSPHDDCGLDREVHYAMYAIEVPLDGAKIVSREGRRHRVEPGNAALVSPGPIHVDESSGYRSVLVFFNDRLAGDFLQQNFREVPVPDGRTVHVCSLGSSGPLWFAASIEAIFHEPKYFPCLSRAMVQDVLLRLVAADPEPVKGFLATAALRDQGGLPAFMAAHATENITNQTLATLSGRSVSAFHRQFGRVFGTTPQKWLMERRLERARSLLTATSMSITQICYETGFRDSAHFSRAFRRRYGLSPRQERDRLPRLPVRSE